MTPEELRSWLYDLMRAQRDTLPVPFDGIEHGERHGMSMIKLDWPPDKEPHRMRISIEWIDPKEYGEGGN